LWGDDYILFDSEPINIAGTVHYIVSIENFLLPLVDKVIAFFDKFKNEYKKAFEDYIEPVGCN